MSELKITGAGGDIFALYNMTWQKPLEDWTEDPQLTDMRGISRHIVRLVRMGPSDEEIFAVKETVTEFANREYTILRELAHRGAPTVEPAAVVEGRLDVRGNELPPALVTRYLPYSLPYRVILSRSITAHEVNQMASALALLLVRLHLLGFWWGDCSLSNTLFRRDATEYVAYLVDAETGEFHDRLTDGQREHDLEIVHFNVAAELEDVEIVVDGEKGMLKFSPKLVAAGYHTNRLKELLGIDAEEFQAKRLLASFDRFRGRQKPPRSELESARVWLTDVYQHVLEQIPNELRGRVEPAQMFHEILEHRWYLGEKNGLDLGLENATKDYIATILPTRTDSGSTVLESAEATNIPS